MDNFFKTWLRRPVQRDLRGIYFVDNPDNPSENGLFVKPTDSEEAYEIPTNTNGSNYLIVYGTGTPEENAAELQAAYNEAKKMPRFIGFTSPTSPTYMYAGQIIGVYMGGSPTYYKVLVDGEYTPYKMAPNLKVAESDAMSVRTTVIVAPGEYNFGASAFVVDESCINIVSLTGNPDVIISSTEKNSNPDYIYGIKVFADNILIKGINCKTNAFYIESYLDNLVCEYCIGGKRSFGSNTQGNTSGTFNYCIAGNSSFGAYGTASGTFNYCSSGDSSFGGYGNAEGTFNNCIANVSSFGAYGTLTGKLTNCKLISGTFPTPSGEGKIHNCIDGDGTLVNYPLIQDLNGTNYLIVYGTGTPEENAAELQAAYDAAKNMPRYVGSFSLVDDRYTIYKGQTFFDTEGESYYIANSNFSTGNSDGGNITLISEAYAKSVRTTLLVAPGYYNFPTEFIHNQYGIDIKSLSGDRDIKVSATTSGQYSFSISTSNTTVKGINTSFNSDKSIRISPSLTDLYVVNCIGGSNCFGDTEHDTSVNGKFIDCEGGNGSFLTGSGASPTLSGTFIRCKGGDCSFGNNAIIANATFEDCEGHDYCFGSTDGEFTSTVKNTTVFKNCWAINYSFGFGATTNQGKYYYCINTGANSGVLNGSISLYCSKNGVI